LTGCLRSLLVDFVDTLVNNLAIHPINKLTNQLIN